LLLPGSDASWYNLGMKKIRIVMLIPLLFTIISCGTGEPAATENLFPEISSAYREFSTNLPEDGDHFTGNWSGTHFDGSTYRNISANSGLRFSIESPATLLLTLRLRAESTCELTITLNGQKLKALSLKPAPPGQHRVLLSRRLLRAGENLLEFNPNPHARVRFYRLAISPPGHPRGFEKKPGEMERILLPASLTYVVRGGEGRLRIKFTEKIPSITLHVDPEGKANAKRRWKDRDAVDLDLAQWSRDPRKLVFRLQGPEVAVGLRVSQRTRKVETAEIPAGAPPPGKGDCAGMNVLVILLDSARADRLSCAGYPRPTTPGIDRLASRAWRFENAWAEAAYTLASTATLFSGLAPDQHNAVSNYFGGLNSNIRTLAEIMSDSGYYTAAVSAIPYCGRSFQMDQGFIDFTELFLDTPQPLASEFPHHLEQIISAAKTEKKPFFAYMHVREPHIDFVMPPPYFGTFHRGYPGFPNPAFLKKLKDIYFARGQYANRRYEPEDLELLRDAYDENLLFADSVVTGMLNILEHRGLDKTTAVIVLGDHGEGLGEHNEIGHNTVLYPEGLHIPMIMAIPGWSDPGAIVSHPVSTSDMTATLIRFFASSPLPELHEKGLFLSRPAPLIISRSIFYSGYHNAWSVLEFPFQAILTGSGDSLSCRVTDLSRDPSAKSPLNSPLYREYFFSRLVNTIRNRRRHDISPTASTLKKKEIDSLKSLGYL